MIYLDYEDTHFKETTREKKTPNVNVSGSAQDAYNQNNQDSSSLQLNLIAYAREGDSQ